jgi:hypothetical protein
MEDDSEQFNGREGAGSDCFIALSSFSKLVRIRFRHTSSQLLGAFW